ncbi:MAG TPA: hypothetical protein VIM46_01075, partial [Luteolibacter sp.]
AAMEAAPKPPEILKTPFARTSPEQEAERPQAARFIGERNTQATSDRAPDASAPPMPSQQGIEDDRDLETTQSRYRDGALDGGAAASPSAPQPPAAPAAPAAPVETPAAPEQTVSKSEGERLRMPAEEAASPPPAPRERLADGPNPVEREVTQAKPEENPKPADDKRKEAAKADAKPAEHAVKSGPKPIQVAGSGNPAFSGFQRKTKLRGSISRKGVSALDVEDSPLGRYQAAISRAVEREWQRNCVRYRDLITPGFLTVRFLVDASGKVRSVGFVEAAVSGEVQKGFTLSSIREAEIPPMPAELKKQLGDEPLELIFNFYF